jgi:hypothetical protein
MPPRSKPAVLPLPPLPPKMTTRPGNKEKHPGDIVKPKPRHTSEELTRIKKAALAKETAQAKENARNLRTLAQLEDWLRLEEYKRETPTAPPRLLKAHKKGKYMRFNLYIIGLTLFKAASRKENWTPNTDNNIEGIVLTPLVAR